MKQNSTISTETGQYSIVYGTFWQRAFALLIDGLILSPLIFLEYADLIIWKSELLLIVIFLITTAYKPFCEFKYSATVGKMAMKLMVVGQSLAGVSLKQVLLRNLFDIATRILSFIMTLVVFRSIEFQSVHSIGEFENLEDGVINSNLYTPVLIVLVIIEIIFLLTDKQKRALHDRIGDTVVIVKHTKSYQPAY